MGFFERGTSNQVWCEYITQPLLHSQHVGEFWNTATSLLFYPLGGILSIWLAQSKGSPWPFTYAGVMLIVVGIGSAVFHATQSYGGEMLDELPMAIMGLSYMWCMADLHWSTSTPYKGATYATYHAIILAAWTSYLVLHNYEIFQLSFVFQVAAPGFLSLACGPAETFSRARWKWWAFLASVLIGRISWDYERWLNKTGQCPPSAFDLRFWLHPIWHLCSTLAQIFWMDYASDLFVFLRKNKSE